MRIPEKIKKKKEKYAETQASGGRLLNEKRKRKKWATNGSRKKRAGKLT